MTSNFDKMLYELNNLLNNKLQRVKRVGNNIMFCCPAHEELNPSCGMAIDTGQVHCFSCGFKGNFNTLVLTCLKLPGNEHIKIKLSHQQSLQIKKVEKKIQKYIDKKELLKYNYKCNYLLKRGISQNIINKYDIRYQNDFYFNNKFYKCVVFPVKTINGDILFLARRDIDSKLYNYPQGVEKPLYGLYELDWSQNYVIICEGIIDTLTCATHGLNSVALLGLGSKSQIKALRELRFRKIILAFDGDKPGQQATLKLYEQLKLSKLVKIIQLPSNKDVNDLTSNEFKEVIKI